MRRKHEFGHGDLVSVTEKEKATSLLTFFPRYLYKICLFDSNNLSIRKDIYIQILIRQYKYVIVDRYFYSEISIRPDNLNVERRIREARPLKEATPRINGLIQATLYIDRFRVSIVNVVRCQSRNFVQRSSTERERTLMRSNYTRPWLDRGGQFGPVIGFQGAPRCRRARGMYARPTTRAPAPHGEEETEPKFR